METARGAPNEGAEMRFDDDGRVALLVGTQSNGMGHETAYAQIAADLLGLPIETFRYVQADTAIVRAGNGHGGARSMHMGGAALCKAVDTMLAKGRAIAARLLQASVEQVVFVDGRFAVRDDPDRAIDLLAVARAARDPANLPDGMSPGLDTYVWNLLDLITFPNGCHIAEVEVDPDTGAVTLQRYTAVDDFGTLINPMLTVGQVQGGVAQGIGQAMLEHTVYDPDSGQMLSGSFMDYALPRAEDLPPTRHHADRRADERQSARRERLRPGRRDRGATGDHRRRAGRAGAARRDAYRHAGDAGTHLACHDGRETPMIGRRRFGLGAAALAISTGAHAQSAKSVLRVVPQAEPQVFDPHQSGVNAT